MGNVYMEADQVRFKDSTYRNVQEGLAAALEGGGGGTTVVANPEGSATADLEKLQVGEGIYGIPSDAGDISYDGTTSGLTADDVQDAIDEVSTDLGSLSTTVGDSSAGLVKDVADIQDLIPTGATTSNKLATASDIPEAVTGNPSGSATAGNLTKLQIGSDIYNVPGASSFVSVTADGVKTAKQIFESLFALINASLITENAKLVWVSSNQTSIMVVSAYGAAIYCSSQSIGDAGVNLAQFTLSSNTGSYKVFNANPSNNSMVVNDYSSNPFASGDTFKFYY